MSFDPSLFRHTMRLWATGVTIVSTARNDQLFGMTVSSFTSVTLEPPLILVCLQKAGETSAAIMESGFFSVSMLAEGQEATSNRFAGLERVAEGNSRFAGLDVIYAETGAPILSDSMGWLDCTIQQVLDGSTHHVLLGKVVAASGEEDHHPKPLLYYNREYRKLG